MARPGPWLVAIAVAAAVVFAVMSAPRTPPPLGRVAGAPPFELTSLDGAVVSLASLRGQVVLVNFWATWCAPCEEEMPAMARLYEALRGQGFELLAVSVDDTPEDVRRFRERLAIPFPVLLDEGKQVSELYQTYRYPESFLIDRDGVIIERYIGPKAWDAAEYIERVRAVIAGS
jgi:peroxiredoxin